MAESCPIELYIGIMGIIPGVWLGIDGNDWWVSVELDDWPGKKVKPYRYFHNGESFRRSNSYQPFVWENP